MSTVNECLCTCISKLKFICISLLATVHVSPIVIMTFTCISVKVLCNIIYTSIYLHLPVTGALPHCLHGSLFTFRCCTTLSRCAASC